MNGDEDGPGEMRAIAVNARDRRERKNRSFRKYANVATGENACVTQARPWVTQWKTLGDPVEISA